MNCHVSPSAIFYQHTQAGPRTSPHQSPLIILKKRGRKRRFQPSERRERHRPLPSSSIFKFPTRTQCRTSEGGTQAQQGILLSLKRLGPLQVKLNFSMNLSSSSPSRIGTPPWFHKNIRISVPDEQCFQVQACTPSFCEGVLELLGPPRS